jgi:hypothetical protein
VLTQINPGSVGILPLANYRFESVLDFAGAVPLLLTAPLLRFDGVPERLEVVNPRESTPKRSQFNTILLNAYKYLNRINYTNLVSVYPFKKEVLSTFLNMNVLLVLYVLNVPLANRVALSPFMLMNLYWWNFESVKLLNLDVPGSENVSVWSIV